MKIAACIILSSLSFLIIYPSYAKETGTKTSTETVSVARALFTTGVADREPVDEIKGPNIHINKIYYFTEIKGMAGQTVNHRWEFNGKVMLEVPFNIGSNSWRVWSSKTLDPNWLGEWKVSVVDSTGKSIGENKFTYTNAGQ